eukprot:scaffold248_cov111-Cylindrotheca_fusiformis.AAC.16
MTEYKYVGYIGCYTLPHQADPFGPIGGFPYDDSKVGSGIRAIGVSTDGTMHYLSPNPVAKIGEDVLPNPSYLAVVGGSGNASSKQLCVVTEMDKKNANVVAFAIDNKDPTKLSPIGDALATEGAFPCHITILDTAADTGSVRKKLVAVCNYGRDEDSSGFSTYLLGEDGLSLAHSIPSGSGQGSLGDISRQLGSHTHSSATCPQVPGELFVADLGTDSIVQFALDHAGVANEIGRLAIPRGSGPRSLVFQGSNSSKLGHVAVVSLEMTAQILLVLRRAHDGCLEAVGSPLSILPDDWPPAEANEDDDAVDVKKFNQGRWASDVVWSKNGKYIFASARLHNSVAIFEFDHDLLELRFVDRVSTGGTTPRCLTVSPKGEFLLIAHQHSHDVSSFRIDETNGTLTFIDKLEAPLASCVKLL